MLYVGKESDREQWRVLHSLPVFSHSLHYPQSNWALLVLLPEWVGLCTFCDPVGLSNELSCEARSFSHSYLNPHRCFHSVVWGFISPCWELWVVRSVTWSTSCCLVAQLYFCPPCSTICHLSRSASRSLATSPLCLAARFHPSYWSGWMFLLYLLGCWTSIQFSFLSVLVDFLFLNCCCPSFGCARRLSVSTHASILAGSIR